jgi:hypothetical protein
MKKFLSLPIFVLVCGFHAGAQTVNVPFQSDKWNKQNAEVILESYKGRESLLLKSGFIYLEDVDLLDGTIEVDMSFPQQRGFPGFAFRIQDLNNFENFYVRPHQSGNPDATQYTPVFNGHAGWQLYHGEGYSKSFAFKFNEWHHIKIELHGLQAEIFIDDMQQPLIKVTELKHDWKAGMIGLISGGAPVRFANFQYTFQQGETPTRMPVPANGTDGVITHWQVSNVTQPNVFANIDRLTREIKGKFSWTTQTTEPSGMINLAKFIQATDTVKTIVAKVIIQSASDQVKELSFGFSDYVLIYLNDVALYAGADNFMSRDYRFLGTMGFFDRIFLPLRKGINELWFVVSEDFGGWGVKARFADMDKISLK